MMAMSCSQTQGRDLEAIDESLTFGVENLDGGHTPSQFELFSCKTRSVIVSFDKYTEFLEKKGKLPIFISAL